MDKKYKNNKKSHWGLCLLFALFICVFSVGCGKKKNKDSGTTAQTVTVITTESTTEATSEKTTATTEATTEDTTEKTTATTESTTEATTEKTTEPTTEITTEATQNTTEEDINIYEYPDKNGTYTSKDDVALYLYSYGKLPKNFITKKEAQKLGWSGGSLEDYAPGKCIGGDKFGNYEGVLPDGNYHECDIDTLGKKSRGAKRLVYSDDGRIYYTEDHYETFTLLYGEE